MMRPLDDIRTKSDNEAAAETILQVVRRFTTDAETRLIGLLAGGRKTMGALLHAALSLSGRKCDRLLHVLVNDPFDDPRLVPAFYFPGQPGPSIHRTQNDRVLSNADARIEIADVPLVALGELVAATTGRLPATFAALARAADEAMDNAHASTTPLSISYEGQSRIFSVNAYSCRISQGRAAALCGALFEDARNGADLVDRRALVERWNGSKKAQGARSVTYMGQGGRTETFEDEDVSYALNDVRKALLTEAKAPRVMVERLFPLRAPIGLNRDGIVLA
jgi:hypothetical protein